MNEPWGLLAGSAIVAGATFGVRGVLAISAFVVLLHLVSGRTLLIPIAVVAIAGAGGAIRAADIGTVPDNLAMVGSTGATGEVISSPNPGQSSTRVLFRVDQSIEAAGQSPPEPYIVVLWVPQTVSVARGDVISVGWTAEAVETLSPSFASWVRSQGASGTAYAHDVRIVERGPAPLRWLSDARTILTARLQAAIPGDPGSLAAGIVTGDDSALSPAASSAFLRTGTSHITAVSGSNVAMLVALWMTLVPPGRARRRLLVQLAVLGTIWTYALMVGLEPPALRAALVGTGALLAGRFGRAPDPMNLLAVASALMVVWNPLVVLSLSFWLSVVASAAFVTVLPSAADASVSRILRGSLLGVVLANVLTLPLIIAAFGIWSPGSILTNLLIQPIVTIAFPLAFLLGLVVLVAPPLGIAIAWLPALVLEIGLVVIARLSTISTPISLAPLGWIGVLVALVISASCGLSMSRDGRRWLGRLGTLDRSGRAAWMPVTVAGLVGIAVGLVAAWAM